MNCVACGKQIDLVICGTCGKAALPPVRSEPLLDIVTGVVDGEHTDTLLRLAAEYLDDAGFGGPLAGKLRAKAARIESALSNAESEASQ